MNFLFKRMFFYLIAVLAYISLNSCSEKDQATPNIVIIYADDMGYGDLACQNPKSKIPTPNLDQLALEGIRFTDAHSSSAICSPSRFALLTGTYHWRRDHGIVKSFGKPYFIDSDVTLANVLQDKGYQTACIGKWHLGWDWKFKNEPSAEVLQWGRLWQVYTPDDVNWEGPVTGGPLDRGFDFYFGDGTINFPPYAWVENDRLTETPTAFMDIDDVGFDTKEGPWGFRAGPKVEGWNPYKVLPTLTERAVDWISSQKSDKPFFLYFALPSPHEPVIPNDEFDGKSEAGGYGDFMYQTDWVAGQVLKALKENGFEDNTIVIFTSDNGPELTAYERALNYSHFSMGELRGLKRDVWEGGHRVPFILKWPGHIDPGQVSDMLISQIDIMATLADIAGAELPENAAPDSHSFISLLDGTAPGTPTRDMLIHNTLKTKWGIRKDNWLYINDASGGHSKMPEAYMDLRGYEDFETAGILFDLNDDLEQRKNLYDQYPDIVKELDSLIAAEKSKGYLIKDAQ